MLAAQRLLFLIPAASTLPTRRNETGRAWPSRSGATRARAVLRRLAARARPSSRMPVTGSIATRASTAPTRSSTAGSGSGARNAAWLLAQLGADTGECGILERRETCIGCFHCDDGRERRPRGRPPARELSRYALRRGPGPLWCIGRARSSAGCGSAHQPARSSRNACSSARSVTGLPQLVCPTREASCARSLQLGELTCASSRSPARRLSHSASRDERAITRTTGSGLCRARSASSVVGDQRFDLSGH